MKNLETIEFLFILSLGRSGSTWIAKTLSEALGATNVGENRYLWQRIAAATSVDERRFLLGSFLKRKGIMAGRVVDKSTNLYLHTKVIEEMGIPCHFVALKRDKVEILKSRQNFSRYILNPKRVKMRIQKYWRDYGWRFFIPLVQKIHYISVALGLRRDRVLTTDNSIDGGEFVKFERVLEDLAGHDNAAILDYHSFAESLSELRRIGIPEKALNTLHESFRR